jgi:hypothetical protein
MLYTGNVNRFIFWILVPLIIISYIAFRTLAWVHYDDGGRSKILEQHSINLRNLQNINCLILGGSNSFFSLSAAHMSREDNLNCYNLSLLNEGYSDDIYFRFIESMPINQNEITNVFYSTILSLNTNIVEKISNNDVKVAINKHNSFKLLGRSFASFSKNLIRGIPFFSSTKRYPVPNSSGDFKFERYDGCQSSSIQIASALVSSDNKVFKQILDARFSKIQSLFQNAKIYFVLPSTFRKKESEYEQSTYYNFLQETFMKHSITYIEQSPFFNRDTLCDSNHHANEKGRKLRTSELLKLIQSQND